MLQIGQQISGDHNYNHGIEESGGNSDIINDQNTDEYVHNLKKGNSNILVAVRCRPLSLKERQKQSQKSVKILDERIIIIQDVSAAKPEEAFRLARSKEKTYAFDFAFDETRNQQYIFDRTTKFLIDGIMQGYNASVFAYGATGAGKTYTMLGTEDNPGIMMNSIEELFRSIDYYQAERDYKLKISYIEVYNELIKDLLTDRNESLDLREDAVKGVCVAGVLEIMTTNTDEIMRYIRQGNRARTKERTDANEASSRSHAVLQITVEHKDKAHGINAEINIAKLSLIDLAGSERASNTNNRGIRLVEGANINRSLLALGNCINALCEQTKGSNGAAANKNTHIPYRDSKLTRLLKDSLGGNCRTVMITNISPAFAAYEDTLNTLKYADRAKQIKTVVKRNVLNVEFHISNYTKIINSLREEILGLRGQLHHQTNVRGPPSSQVHMQKNAHSPSIGGGNNNNNPNSQQAQNKIRAMKIDMNMQFEKEVVYKKEIYELDMKNEDMAFKLFSKQFNHTKNKNKGLPTQQLENEVRQLKQEIDDNQKKKAHVQRQLNDQENSRNKMFEDYQQEMLEFEIEALDVIYNQHLLNLKSIDIKRKENRAEFHIKQRDNYIQHLKDQVSLRDKLIKDRLGLSITNFLSGTQGNLPSEIAGTEILTMQDIDRMSRELILPSLNMTKSSSFIPNQNPNYYLQEQNANNIRQVPIRNEMGDNPYKQNIPQFLSQTPNQRNVSNSVNVSTTKGAGIKIAGIKQRPSPSYIGRPSLQNLTDVIDDSKSVQSMKSAGSNNAYQIQDQQSRYQKGLKHHPIVKQLSEKKQNQNNIELADEQESQINLSFQSHRQNSYGRINVGGPGYPSQMSTPGTNPNEQPKSFASEMSKNKQKYILMQKNPNNDVFNPNGRGGRPIPKNPLSINKKLALVKASAEERNGNHAFQSSRNHHQSQNQVASIKTPNHPIQSNDSSITNFGGRKHSEHNSINAHYNNGSPHFMDGDDNIISNGINIAESNIQF